MKYKDYIKYRYIWMGVAIVWIMMFHLDLPVDNAAFRTLSSLGYAGSDIFYFASGLGVWFSLKKCSGAAEFYKRRARKIFPMYWCFIVLWLVFRFAIGEMTVPMAIGNVLGIQVLFGMEGAFNWYITYLLIFYLLAPFIKKLYDFLKKDLLCLACIGVAFALLYIFCHVPQLTVGLSRLPVFALGMYFGKRTEERERFSLPGQILLLALLPVGYGLALYFGQDFLRGWDSGLLWYPVLLSVPGSCLLLSALGKLWGERPVGIFGFLGGWTMELYYMHIFVLEIYQKVFTLRLGIPFSYLHLLPIAVTILLGCLFLRKVVEWLRGCYNC